jgi:hypothetical protein
MNEVDIDHYLVDQLQYQDEVKVVDDEESVL